MKLGADHYAIVLEAPNGRHAAIVQDDGVVASALLVRDRTDVLSTVWLYNRYPPLVDPDSRTLNPFPRNPDEFVRAKWFPPIDAEDEITGRWRETVEGRQVDIYVRGRIHAILREGETPGWCVLSKEHTSLAYGFDPPPDPEGIFISVAHPESNLNLVIEDDGQVAYAYLLKDGKPASVVWLYNRAPEPEKLERPEEPGPIVNPKPFVAEMDFELPAHEYQFEIDWPTPESVAISIHDRLHATLNTKEAFGRCVLASRDGPVAKSLRPG